MSKTKIYAFIITAFVLFTNAQAQNFKWANSTGQAMTNSMVCDTAGNVYYVGGSTGPGIINIGKKYRNGNTSVNIAISNSAVNWGAHDVAIDDSSNMYVTGDFEGTNINFGNFHTLTSASSQAVFIAKYDSAGTCKWAINTGGGSQTYYGIATDASANFYVIGVGGITLRKYNRAGNPLWNFNLGSSVKVADVFVDVSGNISIIGTFSGAAMDFDPGAGVASLTPTGTSVFVAKYYSNGQYMSAFQIPNIGSSGYDYAINVDASYNTYITGRFAGTNVDFDPGPGTQPLTSGSADAFVAKYNSSNQYQWAFSIYNSGGTGIAADAAGNVYTCGSFGASGADFDPGTGVVNLAYTAGASGETYVASYDASGGYRWAFSVSSTPSKSNISSAICLHPSSGSLYVSGTMIGGTSDFDPGIGVTNLTSSTYLGYVAKYSQCPVPEQPVVISGTSVACSSTVNTYSVAAEAFGTSYTWSLPGGWSGTSTTNTISATASATSGTISVTASNACGSSIAQTKIVTSSSVPATPAAITGATSPCHFSVNTYSITAVAGATSYTWSLPSGWGGSSTTNTISATTGISGGTMSVTVTNSCGTSSPQTLSITVASGNPPQPSAINGTASVCNASVNTYSVALVAGATSYTWSLPGGWTGTSTTNSITATAGAAGGNITVTANNTCGSSTAATKAIVVNSIPGIPGAITGSTIICETSSNTYSVTAVAGATSYTWSLPGGWTGTSTTNSITTTAGATSGNITITADNACGSSTVQNLAVTVNAIPTTPGAISGTSTICSGSSNSYSVTAVPGATSYTWSLPGGWTGTSTTNSITATAGATSGNITVTADNACGSSTVQTLAVTVNAIPATPGTISGTSTICSGSSNSYSVTAVPGATSYTWSLPGGWAGTSTTNSITATAGAAGGNITVTADNTCGGSAVQTLAATVNIVPASPGTISGSITICDGTNNTYSVTAVAGATSYTWSLPGGWMGTSTTNSITGTAGTASGNITITADNTCGSSVAQTLPVTVNALPTVNYSQSPALVCVNNTSVALSTATPVGGTFSGTAVTGNTFDASLAGIGTYTITYTYTDGNSCANSDSSVIVVDPCTGVSSAESVKEGISMYPNPNDGTFRIKADRNSEGTNYYILNSMGQVVSKGALNSNEQKMELDPALDNGIYILCIRNKECNIIRKIRFSLAR